MLATVLRNYINNAIKFTHEGGQIDIFIADHQDFAIVVKDNGTGMSKKEQEKIFKLDNKIRRNGTNGEKGTGLGLIICKEFIDKHRGQVWLESEEGEGTAFYFSIPKKEHPSLIEELNT